MGISLYLVRK